MGINLVTLCSGFDDRVSKARAVSRDQHDRRCTLTNLLQPLA
jgi:hypothetical protein